MKSPVFLQREPRAYIVSTQKGAKEFLNIPSNDDGFYTGCLLGFVSGFFIGAVVLMYVDIFGDK